MEKYPIVINSSGVLETLQDTDILDLNSLTIYNSPLLFVSTVGNDTTGDGTIIKPYLTINKAITEASSDDTIYIYDGVYSETLNYVNKNLKFITHKGAITQIGSIDYSDNWTDNLNLTFYNCKFNSIIFDNTGVIPCDLNLQLYNCEVNSSFIINGEITNYNFIIKNTEIIADYPLLINCDNIDGLIENTNIDSDGSAVGSAGVIGNSTTTGQLIIKNSDIKSNYNNVLLQLNGTVEIYNSKLSCNNNTLTNVNTLWINNCNCYSVLNRVNATNIYKGLNYNNNGNALNYVATNVYELINEVNANKIKNILVDDTNIANGKALIYSTSSGNLEYSNIIGGGGFEGFGGLEFYYISSSAESSSTVNNTYQTKVDYNTPDLTGGIYRIGSSYAMRNAAANRRIKIRIYVDNTTVLQESILNLSSTHYFASSFFGYVTFSSGVHNIKIQYTYSGSNTTVYIKDVYLESWKVSD